LSVIFEVLFIDFLSGGLLNIPW